jgi:putative hydrolase of HD superfamily
MGRRSGDCASVPGCDTNGAFHQRNIERGTMDRIVEFLFETMLLKRIHRTGYQFLGPGRESVAEHTYAVMCVGLTLARMTPGVDTGRLLTMCLVHDMPEARMGDLNTVQKRYVTANEDRALDHLTRGLEFGADIRKLLNEFNAGETLEARLARDADQLAFLIDLKSLADMGYAAPEKWAGNVRERLRTPAGIEIAEGIARTEWDSWWLKLFIDSDTKGK